MRRVRHLFLALAWLALSLSFVSRAHASDGMDCDHSTVESLYLGAFINEVEAQAGIHIDAMHAEHSSMHADTIIDGLLSP